MVENIVRQWASEYGYPEEALKKYGAGEPRVVIVGEITAHEAIQTKEPLLVIIGQYHILDNATCLGGRRSAIHDILKEKGINYTCVDQAVNFKEWV